MELEQPISIGSYPNLHRLVDIVRGFQMQDMDMIIPISSLKGLGKSTLALQITRIYLEKYYPYISLQSNLEKFIAYDNIQVEQNLLTGDDYLPLICDEAVRFAMSEDWVKAESKTMKKLFAQIRIRHRLIILNIPEMFWLDRKYRETMVLLWLHIISRGTALVFSPDNKIGVDDKWHKEFFEKIKGRSSIFDQSHEIAKQYVRHPCYHDTVTFPKCNKDLYAKYLKLRTEALLGIGKLSDLNPIAKIRNRDIIQAVNMKLQGKTNLEIGTELKMPETTVQSMTRGLALPQVKDDNLNPSINIINNKKDGILDKNPS